MDELTDLIGRPLNVGDFVIHAEHTGRTNATMDFAEITKVNPKTKKVSIQPMTQDRQPQMITRSRYEWVNGLYTKVDNTETTDPVQPRVLNWNQGKFYIL